MSTLHKLFGFLQLTSIRANTQHQDKDVLMLPLGDVMFVVSLPTEN